MKMKKVRDWLLRNLFRVGLWISVYIHTELGYKIIEKYLSFLTNKELAQFINLLKNENSK